MKSFDNWICYKLHFTNEKINFIKWLVNILQNNTTLCSTAKLEYISSDIALVEQELFSIEQSPLNNKNTVYHCEPIPSQIQQMTQMYRSLERKKDINSTLWKTRIQYICQQNIDQENLDSMDSLGNSSLSDINDES